MKTSSVVKSLVIVFVPFALGLALTYNLGNQSERKVSRRTETVKKTDLIQRVTIAGNVDPRKKSVVTAQYNGYIKKLYVKTGQKVKKGDPLVSVVQSLQSTDPVFPLRSPLSGTVVQILKEEGEFVKQADSNDYILRVDSMDQLYVISDVPEIERVKIVPGQEAIVKASAVLNKEYKGIVREVALASKLQEQWRGNSKVEYRTRIEIMDFDKDLKSGMSAIVDIVTNKKKDVLVIPHEFILKEDGKYFVFPVEGDKKEIKVGVQNESVFEVLEGVEEGEEVRQVDFLSILSEEKK